MQIYSFYFVYVKKMVEAHKIITKDIKIQQKKTVVEELKKNKWYNKILETC